jgi:CheY-like chemotaxis protein
MMAEALSVLLVEDVRTNLELTELVLRRAGHAVTAVTNGRDALDALEGGEYDVVALDLRLPDMDGLDIARTMKADPNLRKVPVVAITALAMKGDRERALEAGCDEYITKPVDTRTLAEKIQAVVQHLRNRRDESE